MDNIPFDSASTIILHSETIPYSDGALAISREIPEAFLTGKRWVVANFSFDLPNIYRNYHSSKVSFIIKPFSVMRA